MRNIEIKAVVHDRAPLLRYMEEHGTRHEVQHQRDVFFRSPRGRLKLRCFPDGTGILVAYSRPDRSGPKLSDYTLAPVQDAHSLEQALTRTYGVRGIVEKKRRIAIVGQTRIHLDQVKGLGWYLELEVVLRPRQSAATGQKIAFQLMRDLGVARQDLLDQAYIDLLEKKRR